MKPLSLGLSILLFFGGLVVGYVVGWLTKGIDDDGE